MPTFLLLRASYVTAVIANPLPYFSFAPISVYADLGLHTDYETSHG